MKIKVLYCIFVFPCVIFGMQPERLRLLEHLVVNNDMPLLMSLKDAHGVMPEHIKDALKLLSVKHRKPHIFIAACAQQGLADSVALTQWATQQPDLTLEQVDVYYDALDLIKKREKHRASAVHKVLSQGSLANKKLPQDIQNVCKAYFPTDTHPLKPHQMHPNLEKAITDGNLDRVKALIDQGYNLHAYTSDYMDALELATYHGKAAIFRELIKHMPYINPHKQKVLLTYAQREMIPIIAKELPEYITQKNQEMGSVGCFSAHWLASLLSGASPNSQLEERFYNSMTERAVYLNEPGGLKILLNHGADHNHRNGTPLTHTAVRCGHSQCLQVLLEHGANPNATFMGSSLLRWAECSRQEKELVPLLKKHGAQYTTLEKYPEIIDVPLGIVAGSLVTKAVGNQITAPFVAGIASVSVLTSMVMRAYYRYENN